MWQEKIWESPLTKEFLKKFGGKFGIHPNADWLFYVVGTWEKSKSFDMPDNETKFWDMISQSIKENKNLLLTLPSEMPRT